MEIISCRKLIHSRDIGVLVTLSFKIMSELFLGFRKVKKIYIWKGHWLGGVGVHYGVTFNFGSAKVCLPPIFGACFSYDKDIWMTATDYY